MATASRPCRPQGWEADARVLAVAKRAVAELAVVELAVAELVRVPKTRAGQRDVVSDDFAVPLILLV